MDLTLAAWIVVLLISLPAVIICLVLARDEYPDMYHCPECGGTMEKTGKRSGFLWRHIEMHCPRCKHTKWCTPSPPLSR